MIRIVKIVRRVMARRGDAKLPVWITELSWPAAQGKTIAARRLRDDREAARSDRLEEGLPLLADERRKLRIGRVYWYTWLSVEGITDSAFDYSGLRRLRDGQLHDAPVARRCSRAWRAACRAARSSPATPCAAANAFKLPASCGDETATGLSFRSGRSGACCWRRWPAASASSMLPLGADLRSAGSAATAGALVAAFSVASALAPVRGRIVDRHGPRALAAFALACAVATWALVLAVGADAPAAVVVALGGLAGLVVPPLGPFTRAALGRALRERGGAAAARLRARHGGRGVGADRRAADRRARPRACSPPPRR